jgi:hypothetical protein
MALAMAMAMAMGMAMAMAMALAMALALALALAMAMALAHNNNSHRANVRWRIGSNAHSGGFSDKSKDRGMCPGPFSFAVKLTAALQHIQGILVAITTGAKEVGANMDMVMSAIARRLVQFGSVSAGLADMPEDKFIELMTETYAKARDIRKVFCAQLAEGRPANDVRLN